MSMPLEPRRIESCCSQASAYSDACDSQASYYDDGLDDDPKQQENSAAKPVAVVLDGIQLAEEQETQIGHIAGLLEVSKPVASVLLRQFHWNTERLTERYFEDTQRVLEQAGVANSAKRQRSGNGECSSDAVGSCAVCMDELTHESSTALRCGHRFCNDCWSGHISVQIGDGNAQAIRCMGEGCAVLIDPALVQGLVDGATWSKYARFAQKQFVDDVSRPESYPEVRTKTPCAH